MHELGILSSMLKTIEQVVADEELSTVEKIVLQVGELSGVVSSFLEECFPAATYKTQFENTKLELEVVPGIIRCRGCGTEFRVIVESEPKCPNCESGALEAVGGTEFIIKELHAY